MSKNTLSPKRDTGKLLFKILMKGALPSKDVNNKIKEKQNLKYCGNVTTHHRDNKRVLAEKIDGVNMYSLTPKGLDYAVNIYGLKLAKVKVEEVKTLSIPEGLTEKQTLVYSAILKSIKGETPSAKSTKVMKLLKITGRSFGGIVTGLKKKGLLTTVTDTSGTVITLTKG